jgi:hypothetical protein
MLLLQLWNLNKYIILRPNARNFWACDALMETPFLDDENDKHDRKLVIYDTCPSGSVIMYNIYYMTYIPDPDKV